MFFLFIFIVAVADVSNSGIVLASIINIFVLLVLLLPTFFLLRALNRKVPSSCCFLLLALRYC